MKALVLTIHSALLIFTCNALADESGNNSTTSTPQEKQDPDTKDTDDGKKTKSKLDNIIENSSNLSDFSFAPALYLISYDNEILQDSKDVKIRSDGKLSSSGSKYSTSIGLEVHYNLSFGLMCKHQYSKKQSKLKDDMSGCEKSEKYDFISGHTISPYIGLYDFNNGINGLSVGALYGYWKVNSETQKSSSLNIGLGWTVHKDRLVLADDFKEGQTLDPSTNLDDLTERQDIKGLTLMISAYIGF
ncbi:MAG: hypothetical protein N0C81_18805 [Candidatus Thiodiazotropha lotti]|nr:hypothetical protein [Candidatus Thiodiazotropha lotti]ODB98771.1 hypothetical protein A3197_15245 [Candidatus Thiodiazotropha endoloripes]MCG7919936.1 hypothetical protein [Candidatus Thiodiazotropha lotti]MCG8001887.1 hypothetical protein [Candidatus Thiodiazotropha lotti]MCG8009677.1 hypothetical protein [Candidatus Thiodiazotropha lotti]